MDSSTIGFLGFFAEILGQVHEFGMMCPYNSGLWVVCRFGAVLPTLANHFVPPLYLPPPMRLGERIGRCTSYLKEVREARVHLAKVKGQAPQKPSAIAETAQPPSSWKSTYGWPVLGVGAAGLGFGIWWLLRAQSAQADLDEHIDPDTGKYKWWIDVDKAAGKQEAINGQVYTGWAATGAGLAVLTAGVWMIATAPSKQAALAPMPTVQRPSVSGFQ